jgi:hypothetical protein
MREKYGDGGWEADEEVCGRPRRPARPGSREERGAMALRVWVRAVAPAFRAIRPSV